MPLFNFMYQFHPYIKDGSKPGTIRTIRKNPCKPGDTISLYSPRFRKPYGPIIGKQVCTDVKTIFMLPNGAVFEISALMDIGDTLYLLADDAFKLKQQFENDALSTEQKDMLAWQDGFRSTADPDSPLNCFNIMYGWWKSKHQLDTTPFAGHHIFWK